MSSVLITGGRKGLGRALTIEFASRGWQVFTFSREMEDSLQNGVHRFKGDVTNSESIERIRKCVGKITGSVDVLVNNAGYGGSGATLTEVSPDAVAAQFEVHCLGVLRVTSAFSDLLSAAPSPVVMNLTSRFGSTASLASGELNGSGISYSYRIGKAAQNMVTQCLAHDPGLSRITFVAVNPGKLLTDSAARDADMEPAVAAKAIVELIVLGGLKTGTMVHALGGQVEW